MLRAVAIAVVACSGCLGRAPADATRGGASSAARQRVLLAVFAHPDDELTVGPVLARYARAGVKVYLAVATDGAAGVEDHAGIPAGEALAKTRAGEIACAARELGIEPPILYAFPDGHLGAAASGTSAGRLSARELERVAARIRETITTLRPDVILTWGPEGGYGHPDHRLVGTLVTQEVQAGSRARLYFPGWTRQEIQRSRSKIVGLWYPVDEALLAIRILYDPVDLERAARALRCHSSQFAPPVMEELVRGIAEAWGGQVRFQPWSGRGGGADLFTEQAPR